MTALGGYELLSKGTPYIVSPGVNYQRTREEYDGLGYFNQSVLKKWIALRTVPSAFRYWLDHRDEDDRECLLLGGALDTVLLEPFQFAHRYAIVPKCDRRTKAGKNLWESFQENLSATQRLLTQDQYDLVKNMHAALEAKKSLEDVFTHCRKAQLVASWDGFPCKAEADLWMDQGDHIMDIKMARDVTPGGFWKAFYDYGYRYQATFYLLLARLLGFEKRVFDFITVQNEPPFSVKVYSFAPEQESDHEAIFEFCKRALRDAIQELAARLLSEDFRDDEDWELIQVPGWAVRKSLDNSILV